MADQTLNPPEELEVKGDVDNHLLYRLPKTFVRAEGAVTWVNRPAAGAEGPWERSAKDVALDVALASVADADYTYYLNRVPSLLKDKNLVAEFRPDSALASINHKSTGRLGGIIRNMFSLVSSVVLPFTGVGAVPGVRSVAADAPKPEELYAQDHERMAEQRANLKEAIEGLQASISAALKASFPYGTPAQPNGAELDRYNAETEGKMQLLERLRAEAQRLDAHFEAWLARKVNKKTEKFTFALDIGELPADAKVRQAATTFPDAEDPFADLFEQDYPGFAKLYERLERRYIVTQHSPDEQVEYPTPNTRIDGVLLRHGRPVRLSVYEVKPGKGDNAKPELILQGARYESVLDDRCKWSLLPTSGGLFSKREVDVTFGDDGHIKRVGHQSEAELAAATEALKDLPKDYYESLQQTNKIIDERQKLAQQGIEFRIDSLKKQREEVELSVAAAEALSSSKQTAAIERIDGEIDLLESQLRLASLQQVSPAGDQLGAVELQRRLLEAETGLHQAELKRLEVEMKLEELRDEDR